MVAVLVMAGVLVVLNVAGRDGGARTTSAPPPTAPTTAAAPVVDDDPQRYAELSTAEPEAVAEEQLAERGEVAEEPAAPDRESLADSAEQLARDGISYSFRATSLNILGSQHTAPGGGTRGFADGVTRTRWAADLLASYGSSIVGLQEVQVDQLAALLDLTGGTFDAWPAGDLGGAGVPQSVLWDNRVWRPTYTGSITVPFVGTTRPQPIVRLQHLATGRELYVLNIHNSPRDRQAERDQALAIETAAVRELRGDGVPVLLMGDFNERDRAFCTVTGQTDLLASNGGSHGPGGCRPPGAMRIDWIFASPDAQLSGHLTDDSAAVDRITDHAVISTDVSVP